MVRIKDKAVQNFEIKHRNQVRDLAAECTVLLKKDGTFPLDSVGKIAVYGNGVRRTIKGGTGSGDVNVRHFVNVEEGLENKGFEITTKKWLDGYHEVFETTKKAFCERLKEEAKQAGIQIMIYSMGKTMIEPDYDLPLDGEGNVAIYVLTRNSGEGSDRAPVSGDVLLTETEKRDILAINEKYEKFMLVLNVGGMVDLSPVNEVKNILVLGQLGMPTGDVLADLLVGDSYPSGKLTMTWTDIFDYPSTKGFGDWNDTYYNEGIYVGYRYFDTVGQKVLYPFGFGLGYTEFQVKASEFYANEKEIVVTAQVTNVGNQAGKEVVQVYYSAPTNKLDRPYQELAGFAKTKELQPNESCEVTVRFKTVDMAAYDEETASYLLEQGEYVIRVGNGSRNTHICGVVSTLKTVVTRKLKNICDGDKIQETKPVFTPFTYDGEEQERVDAKVVEADVTMMNTEKITYSCVPEELPSHEIVTWDEVKAGRKSVKEFVGYLSNEELANVCIGAYAKEQRAESIIGAAAFSVAGAAGETTHHLDEKYQLDHLVMADGPAGVRVSSSYKILDGQAKSCELSFGEFFLDLLGPEELEVLNQIKPSDDELAATTYYQYCTAIPIGTELAQTFNLNLVKTLGDLVGEEMEMFGIHLWLAPALNIHRSPLCGRNFEYYSEDPLVSGLMAAAMTTGVQQHKGCATTIKHFAGNNQETNRYTSNSIMSERALREIYLRGFEICVKLSQPHTLMSSYNLINGEHACTTKDIQTDVLRDEWGYQGFVMTDWLVTTDAMKGIGSKYDKASAAGCVKAGNDMVMPGRATDHEDMMKALADLNHPYHLTRVELQVSAMRILNMILKLV